MEEAPPRPSSVPAGAVWIADLAFWELGDRDAAGVLHGPCRRWRADGSLALECRYAGGELDGPFRSYHPSGALAREGEYRRGALHGTVVAHASDDPGAEPLRACCVPAGARRMRARYLEGQLMRESFFDGDDRSLLSDGRLRPPRPPGVPETAELEEWSGLWSDGALDASVGRVGTWQFWDSEGRLAEEIEHDGGRRVARRRFAPDGALIEDTGLADDERLTGPYRRRFGSPREGGHEDLRIREVRGAHDRGQVVGRWQFLDGGGQVLRTIECGVACTTELLLEGPALEHVALDAAAWARRAEELAAAGRVRESWLAAARAAGASSHADSFARRLEREVVPLTALASETLLSRLEEGQADAREREVWLVDALVRGADAATVLRLLAAGLTGRPLAARDLVEAAHLLAPDAVEPLVTRALVRIDLGDREGALSDAARVESDAPNVAAFVRAYERVAFPRWSFPPAVEELPELPEELPVEPAQPSERVRWAIALYATRIERVRRELVRRLGGAPPWAPPALAALAPDGEPPLEAYEATIEDEDEHGNLELTQVAIDESLDVAGEPTVPGLVRIARAAWAALGWLCWSVGLDAPGVPSEVVPRAEYPRALALALSRAFRAQDALVTGGLRSMTQGVPSFTWEGLEVDELPRVFAQVAADEWREVRAVLLWLSNPGNVSPFQDDLRRV